MKQPLIITIPDPQPKWWWSNNRRFAAKVHALTTRYQWYGRGFTDLERTDSAWVLTNAEENKPVTTRKPIYITDRDDRGVTFGHLIAVTESGLYRIDIPTHLTVISEDGHRYDGDDGMEVTELDR